MAQNMQKCGIVLGKGLKATKPNGSLGTYFKNIDGRYRTITLFSKWFTLFPKAYK